MSSLSEREKAFENKFAHDDEIRFKVIARRNKLLGLWAAEQMGMTADKAEEYAREVVTADFDEPGDEDVFQKVYGDLKAKGLEISEHRVRRQMEELIEEAKTQIMNEV